MQNVYSLAQIVSMVYANIEKYGLYQDNFCDWSRKAKSHKTWGNSKAHLAQSFKETRRSSRTSRTEGYVAQVHDAQAKAELFTKMQQDHTLAIANLTTATQAVRTSVALLTKTISELSGQVVLLTEKLTTAQAVNARMKQSGQQSTTSRFGHRASRNTTPADHNPSQDRNLYS